MGNVDRIVLIGFSGTGKSSVARRLAERLGWSAADSDVEIERQWGATIPAIFRDHGESAFRSSERAILKQLLARDRVVIATGGGAAVDPEVWDREMLGGEGTLVLALDASPETILARLQRQAADEGAAVERPLLAGADPLARIRDLKVGEAIGLRQSAPDTFLGRASRSMKWPKRLAAHCSMCGGQPLSVRLDAASGASDIRVGPGVISRIGEWVRDRWPKARRAWIVTDANVGPLHARRSKTGCAQSGFSVSTHAVAPGEGSKSLGTAGELYDWLLGGGVERGDVIVALGGGVVGDLAGFVAATVLRGIGLVQVPTSLLAAVDSSVGGKTGINHAAGKNLIGAFLQPPLVIVDTASLADDAGSRTSLWLGGGREARRDPALDAGRRTRRSRRGPGPQCGATLAARGTSHLLRRLAEHRLEGGRRGGGRARDGNPRVSQLRPHPRSCHRSRGLPAPARRSGRARHAGRERAGCSVRHMWACGSGQDWPPHRSVRPPVVRSA